MTKDIHVGDLALCELLAGRTEAPAEVLQDLATRGHVRLSAAGVPSLTEAGRRRAESLKDWEQDLRLMFASGKGNALNTDGGARLHIGGGVASFRM